MNIVIEGCDGTGKSTLAKFLAERFGLYYWHESAPRSFDEYCQMLKSGGVVFDRFCFGQFVYNETQDRKLNDEGLRALVRDIFPATNTLLIYVDCSTEEIIKRLIARGEGSAAVRPDMEKWIKNIRGTYRAVLRESGAEYIEIDGGKGCNILPI